MIFTVRRGCVVAAGVLSLCAPAPASEWEAPAGFYDSATGAGAALRSQLYDIMRTGHVQRTYGEFRDSAAVHDADPNVPGHILLGYNRASVDASWDSGATWNREHVWPQSRQPGSASNGSRGNLGDPHALRPMNPSINNSRGNKPFGLPDTIGSFRSLGTYYFVGDADRGDIARSLMYSETRYGPESGLGLVNGFPSGNQMGDLESLVAWHYLDPPDAFERRRNHTIWSDIENPFFFTNNRNAYVDRPGFVWSVYMNQANDSRLFVGEAADANGASSLVVDGGAVFVGATPLVEVEVHRDGTDGVYFEVTPDAGTFSPQAGRHNAFAINGGDTSTIQIGFDAGATGVSGLVTAAVMIDNLDVTSGGGIGRGANDADDIVLVDVLVHERGEASWDSAVDLDFIEVDLGSIAQDSGPEVSSVAVFNLGAGGLVADVDAELDSVSGDDDRFAVTPSVTVTVGGGASISAAMLDDVAGSFSAEFVYRVFDDRDIPGFAEGMPLTLRLTGEVISACPGDLDGDGSVGSLDLALLLSSWEEGNGAELAALLAAWGPCP